jgi:hypothetical protein
MRTEDFNHDDLVLVELTDYIYDIDKRDVKPVKVIKKLEFRVSVNSRGKRTIIDATNGYRRTAILKNFKKDQSVKGSFGMIQYKNSWLNIGFRVIGGLEAIRENKLKSLGL